MQYKRRLILRSMIGLGTMLSAISLMPRAAWAKWSEAYDAESADDALMGLFNTKDMSASDKIKMKIPEIAENGAVVPVSIKTDLPNVKSISVLANKNPTPLAASFSIPEGTAPDVSVRIRLGETQNVKAVVETADGLFFTEKEVKVTIGGCGG